MADGFIQLLSGFTEFYRVLPGFRDTAVCPSRNSIMQINRSSSPYWHEQNETGQKNSYKNGNDLKNKNQKETKSPGKTLGPAKIK